MTEERCWDSPFTGDCAAFEIQVKPSLELIMSSSNTQRIVQTTTTTRRQSGERKRPTLTVVDTDSPQVGVVTRQRLPKEKAVAEAILRTG